MQLKPHRCPSSLHTFRCSFLRVTTRVCRLLPIWMIGVGLLAKEFAPYDADRFFDTARLVRVDLKMATEGWNKMRVQERSLIKTLRTDLPAKERDLFFEDFPAELVVNGVSLGSVSVRKKGFVGSLSPDRPSLKIKLDKYDKEKRFAGLQTLTLNNNRQDPSRLNQVIGYALFRKAGLLASRCNLAFVTLNGQPLGIYSNVESVDALFFKHRYPQDEGSLWEGTVADFSRDGIPRFEWKFGPQGAAEPLSEVLAALERPDEEVLSALEKILDVDAFMRFWAMEVLVGHWDGYASNRNNYFIYYHAAARRLKFIPWGIDQLAEENNMFWGDPSFVPPKSVKAATSLTRRLYNLSAGRERYFAAMRALLKETWNEGELKEQFQSLHTLLRDYPSKPSDFDGQRHASLEEFVKTRRVNIEKEIKPPYPEWTLKPFGKIGAIAKVGALDLEFALALKKPGAVDGKLEEAQGKVQIALIKDRNPVVFANPTFNIGSEKTPWGGTKWTVLISRASSGPKDLAAVEVTFYAGFPGADPTGKPMRLDAFASPAQARLLEPVASGTVPKGLAITAGQLRLMSFDPGKGVVEGKLSGELFASDQEGEAN